MDNSSAHQFTLTSANVISDFPSRHNHRRCVKEAIQAARTRCEALGMNLTPLREQILELVWSRHGPIGAYDILEKLKSGGRKAAPNTVYRALEFLQESGLVHRLDTLNAFIGCPTPEDPHAAQFLICTGCGLAAEVSDPVVKKALEAQANQLGFQMSGQTVEISGLCGQCRHA